MILEEGYQYLFFMTYSVRLRWAGTDSPQGEVANHPVAKISEKKSYEIEKREYVGGRGTH